MRLLKHINDLQQSHAPSPEGTIPLQVYCTQYNQIMDEVFSSAPRIDPLVKLPSDLWLPILRYAVADRTPFDKDHFSLEMLFTLTLVSRRWRRIVMQESALWTNIRLDDGYDSGQDTAALLATYLHLSQARYLNITFILPLPSWDSVRDSIATHRSRITSIVFRQGALFLRRDNIPNALEIEATSILRSLSPMSNLMEVKGLSTDFHWLMQQGTPLVDVRPSMLSAKTLSLPSARYIGHIITVEELRVILNLAQSLPRVETVRFLQDTSTRNHISTFIEPKDIEPNLPKLLSWTSLFYDQPVCEFPLWLLDRLPHLTNLHLRLNCAHFGRFMGSFSHLLHLGTMLILLEFEQADSITLPSTIPSCPSLEYFLMSAVGTPRFDTSTSFQHLYKLLAKAAVNVRTLNLNGTAVSSPYLILNEDGFQALEDLFLKGYEPHHLLGGELTWFPPSLRRLHISFPNLKTSQAYCSTVEDLLIPDSFDLCEDLSMAWPQLKRFQIGGRLKWRSITHQNLRDIIIFSRPETGGKIATEFCRDVALQPSNLPALESISLHHMPEWDILFIMLERKNFVAQSGVSRIKRLSLPGTCPTRFRRPLYDLLHGYYTDRPSNYDLSIVGNAEIILDGSM